MRNRKLLRIISSLSMVSIYLGLVQPIQAQQSISIPKPAKLPAPNPAPNPTFGLTTPPPNQGYSPAPFRELESRQLNTYRLDIADIVSINVEQFPEFNFLGPIDSEGNIILPILGRLPVLGLTLQEVQTRVSTELGARFLLAEPTVIAVLSQSRPASVTLIGEVFRPGFYTVTNITLITDLIAIAGGTTSEADLRSVIVRRTLIDGTVLEEELDLYTPLVTGSGLPRLTLQGGDSVIISKLEGGSEQDYDRLLIARTSIPQQQITVRLLAPLQPSGQALRNLVVPNGSSFLDVIASLPLSDPIRVNITEVALLRFDSDQGRVITQVLNARTALQGDISQIAPLQDQDVVVVSRTLIGKVFAAFNILTQPIRDIRSFSSILNTNFGGNNNNNNR